MNLTEYVAEETNKYISRIPKAERKNYGQFFTDRETAEFMAGLFGIPAQASVSVLDPGAGAGMLSASVLQRLEKSPGVRNVDLLCYETDRNIIPFLSANLEWLRGHTTLNLSYTVRAENYILSQASEYFSTIFSDSCPAKFDLIIGNPPYMKLPKDSPEAQAMPDICCGTPNLYFLFASMSMFNLREGGEMVYIIPRSWTSGAYFRKFREKLLSEGVVKHIHIFAGRDKVFANESILQETIIIRLQKTSHKPDTITITGTQDSSSFSCLTSFEAPYNAVISDRNCYVRIASGHEDIKTLERIQTCKSTLPELGLRMKTGLVVDFRHIDLLREHADKFTVPVFYPHNIRDGRVIFPAGKKQRYITADKLSLLQENVNYLFVKRFTSKEEARRLQCGVYLPRDFPDYGMISTNNKLNFIAGTETEIYGLYVLLNSALYDNYYRMLNGSTQVNSSEINNMPVPGLGIIESMGQELISAKDMSVGMCDKILRRYL